MKSRLDGSAELVVLTLGWTSMLAGCPKPNASSHTDIAAGSAVWQRGLTLTVPEWETECHALAADLKVDYAVVRRIVANSELNLGETARTQKMTSTMGWSQASVVIRTAAKREGIELDTRGVERVGVLSAKVAKGMAWNNEVDATAAFQ